MRPQRPKNPKWALPWIELRHGKHNEERHALFGFPGLKPSRENERGTSRWFCQAGQVSGACTDGSNSPTVRLNRDQIVTRFVRRRQVSESVCSLETVFSFKGVALKSGIAMPASMAHRKS